MRYQACDDKLCYPPVTDDVAWTVDVVGTRGRVTRTQPDVFDRIAFGTGEQPLLSPRLPRLRQSPSRDPTMVSARLDEFTVAATTGGYQSVDDFLTFIKNAENGVKEEGLFEGRGPLAILLLVLLGGLALNLTPCVLPMIPINLAIIGAGAKAGSRSRGFVLGGVYGAAMALVYGLLGVIVITTASKFGTINASPWFNLVDRRRVRRSRNGDVRRAHDRFLAIRRIGGHGCLGQGHGCARVRHGGDRGAARGRVRRARRHPSRAVLERSVRAGNGRWRSACRSCWAWGWRSPGRSPGRV